MAIDQVATVEVRVNGEEAKQELKNLETIASGLKRSWQMLTRPVIHLKSSRSLPSFGKRRPRLRR